MLARSRPISMQFDSAHVIWAYWNTGTRAFAENVAHTGKLRRLILPHPFRRGVELMAAELKKPTENLQSNIRSLTEEAQRQNVEVKWFSGLPSNTIMLGNPESGTGWLNVETLQASLSAQDRPSFRVEQVHFPHLYAAYLAGFREMWDRSEDPIVPFPEQVRDLRKS